MHSTTYQRWLPHPPELVWAFIADPLHDPVWRKEVIAVHGHSGGVQPDASYSEDVAWEGVVAQVNMSVTELDSGSKFTVVSEDPGYRSTSAWTFTAHNGGTQLDLKFSLDASGPLRLVEPFMWAILDRWLERDLDSLSEHVEAFSAQNAGP